MRPIESHDVTTDLLGRTPRVYKRGMDQKAVAPKRARGPAMQFDRRELSDNDLRRLYEALLTPRLIEEKMLLLLRQGKVSKWFSGIGQEAVAVGSTLALEKHDYILPLHRNLGVFTSREVPWERLFAQWQGKPSGYTQGRDRSFHFGSVEHRIIGMISHLGAMLGVADGLALASLLDQSGHIALVYSGDGGASEGDFHEAINVAAVWDLPVIFLVENNGYGLSTPSSDQFRCKQFIDKAPGYGIDAVQVDGNNILDVYHAVRQVAADIRKRPRPFLLEAMTFRMRGHEEASGTKYVPQSLFDTWAQKDPLNNYEGYLVGARVLEAGSAAQLRQDIKARINAAWDVVFAAPDIEAKADIELGDVYAPALAELVPPPNQAPERTLRYVDALSEGLRQAMQQDPALVLMGQDVAGYGGVFKVSDGFLQEFGKERVRNTPLCESAIVAAGLGLAIAGRASIVEMQFADFVACAFNQIVNNLAKTHYRWGQSVNVTVRMPTGAGTAAGPFHSQSDEAWFTHVPGLKVVFPATPYDAKGLITAAVRDPNPVIFFEHKLLYRSLEGDVPAAYYTLPLGEAQVVQAGDRATVVTYGAAVHWAQQAVRTMGKSVEVIDLRSLLPWDKAAGLRIG